MYPLADTVWGRRESLAGYETLSARYDTVALQAPLSGQLAETAADEVRAHTGQHYPL